jgi:hypothetical protein
MAQQIAAYLFNDKYQKFRFWSAFTLYFLILTIGSIPGARHEIGQFAPGVILHSTAYAVITFFLFTGFLEGSRLSRSIRALLIVALMGALDEMVQSFFPYRHAAVSDWLVDCIASLITLLLLAIVHRYGRKSI